MNQDKIGKFIAKKRKEKNLTQIQFAEKLGVSDRSVSNWENGKNMPDMSLFPIISKELNITINDLMSGEIVEKKEYQQKFEENIIYTIDNRCDRNENRSRIGKHITSREGNVRGKESRASRYTQQDKDDRQ